MKEFKLMSNTEFGNYCRSRVVDFENEQEFLYSYVYWYNEVRDNYDNFLSQPLKLEFFVPCDEGGNVLEEPKTPWQDLIMHEGIHEKYHIKLKEFQIAKEKVLFDGWHMDAIKSNKKCIWLTNGDYLLVWDLINLKFELLLSNTVEYLVGKNLILTESAINQIGL